MAEIKKIEWDDSYLLGVPEIDMQHKKLISIANELYDIVNAGGSDYKAKMSVVLKNLTDYTQYHFSNEEEIMKKIGYAGFEAHKNVHGFFIKEVDFQVKKLSAGDRNTVLNFYNYIAGWVFSHIAKADKVWAAFRNQN